MIIHEISFYRKNMDLGWEFISSRLFKDREKAKKVLRDLRFELIPTEETLYYKDKMRANLIERSLE